KDLGAVRVAADYTNFGTWENRSSNANFGVSNYSDDTDIQSIGISAYYDVEQFRLLNGKLTPYVGARLGYVDYDRNFNYVYANGTVAAGSGSDSDVGYGIIGGVQYALMPNIAIDANVEYHDLGSYDVKDVVSMDYSQKGFNVGVRYNF
ncbi:MAG: opacity family porin, partial [Moraxella sp.]|nr:opacity family porin [Moraxella sp.]